MLPVVSCGVGGSRLRNHCPWYILHRSKPRLLLRAASFSNVRRCFKSLGRWVTTVFHTILSFRICLHAFLNSTYITSTSHSVNLIFYQNCYWFRTSSFISRLRRNSPSVRVLASTTMLSVPLDASFRACALRGAPATGFVTPAILSQVTLRPRSVLQLCFPEFQTHNTTQLPYRAPIVQTSRSTSQ